MNIGILKEPKGGRVIITPETTKMLSSAGHNVFFVTGAGYDSGYLDEEYESSGAVKKFTNEDVVKSSELLTSYRMPSLDTLEYLNKKHTLLSYSNIVKNYKKANTISRKRATLIGLEFIEDNNERCISNKIGKMAAHVAHYISLYFYSKPQKGSGRLIGNFSFSPKTNITIIGCGNIGQELATLFSAKNCNVNIFDNDVSKFNNITEKNINVNSIFDKGFEKTFSESDIIFSTIFNNIKPTKQFIKNNLIETLKPNSMIFDMTINQGGTFETSKDTNLSDPVYVHNKIIHCCPSDILQHSGKTLSNHISHYLHHYIALLSEGYGDSSCFSKALLIDKGTINKDIGFIDEEIEHELITDPFDLMDEEISQSWKYLDDVNDLLEDIDDYNHESL
jgi:alanine dehydrogenase